ncbi:MAG: agmatinase [bacterium]
MNFYKETNFIACDATFKESKVVLAGLPYDGTSSFRPGSRFAPDAIRKASYSTESFSAVAEKDIADYKVCDMGNLEFPFGDRSKVLSETTGLAAHMIGNKKTAIYIGGEHLLTYPILTQYKAKYPNLRVVYWDAHADMRDDYLGDKLSHATAARRTAETVGADRLFMFGIRSFEKQEYLFMKKKEIFFDTYFEKFFEVIKKIKKYPVYFSLDMDVFDPAALPGLGTPEAGGIFYKDFLRFLEGLKQLNIVGMDVLELAPNYDASGNSSVFAAKVIRELILSAV